MAWSVPATVTSGQKLTAAFMNTHLRDNLQYLYDTRRTQSPTNGNGGGGWSQLMAAATTYDFNAGIINSSFTKRQADTDLIIISLWSFYITTSSANMSLGFRVGGTDYLEPHSISTVGVHQERHVIVHTGAIAAGTYAIAPRIRNTSGAGWTTQFNSQNELNYDVWEVAA